MLQKKRRLWALLLSGALLVAQLPIPAMAANPPTEPAPCTNNQGCALGDGHEGDCAYPITYHLEVNLEYFGLPADFPADFAGKNGIDRFAGQGKNPDTYTSGEAVELKPADNTGKYIFFVGWYTDPDYTSSITEIPMDSTGPITLYAKPQFLDDYIYLEALGGRYGGSNPFSTSSGQSAGLGSAERQGFAFVTWSEAVTIVNGQRVADVSDPNKTHNAYSEFGLDKPFTVLYAAWEPAEGQVEIHWLDPVDSGQVYLNHGVKGNQIAEPGLSPSRKGYTFDNNWYKDRALNQPWDFGKDTVPADLQGALTLYAGLRTTSHRLEVNAGAGGTVSGTPAGSYGTDAPISLTAAPDSGYAFSGWRASGVTLTSPTANPVSFAMPDNDVTVTAEFQSVTGHTVTFDPAGGTRTGGGALTQIVSEGTSATAPTVTRSGYAFAGWDRDFSHVTADLTVTAQWNQNDSTGGSDRDDRPSPTEQAVSKVDKAKDGDTVKVDLPSNGKVPGKVLEAAAGKDITLEIDAGSGVTWIIHGKDIPKGKLANLNLKVDAKADTIPVTVINTVTGDQKVMQLALSHNGDFGFALTLRLDTGKDNAGLFANLYYYNETEEALEYQTTAQIGPDGNAELPFTHASSYAVIIDKESHAPVTEPEPEPKWENPFADVGESDWFYDAAEYVYKAGLMMGVTETAFQPTEAVTRAQVWTVLARLDGVDVAGGEPWYAPGQAWAVSTGVSDGTDPDGAVTREQLVTMLYRCAQSAGLDVSIGKDTNILSYTDALDAADWAVPAFQWACGSGIVSGTGETTLSPQAGATRAQLAVVLQRFSSGTK